jgi:flagellar basal body P-ring protein FlgI
MCLAGLIAIALLAPHTGCQAPWMKKKKPEIEVAQPDDLEPEVQFVGDLTRGWGLGYMKVEGIALVTNLRGTGSDPPPNDRRESLREEMKTNGVAHPDDILALDSVSMAYVKAYFPPGIRKGERCDVIVEAPPRTETTSLREGWLMKTRLRPVEVLGNRLRQGKVLGIAAGPMVVDAAFKGDTDKINLLRGRVLGGGEALIDRPIGLVVIGENHSIMTSTHVAAAVNRRFSAFIDRKKVGAAEPMDDDYIELKVNDTYKNNLGRYLRVVQNIAVHETPQQRISRLSRLESLLLEPISASRAAIRLEAIGPEAIPVLRKGMQSSDPEVRFYSAEALAYLDDAEAPAVLAAAAADSRAFRWHALAALSVVTHASAYDALTNLLHVPSVEARCGAIRAIRTRSASDPIAVGQVLSDPESQANIPTLRLVTVPSPSEPIVHFMRYREAEMAIFGQDVRLRAPFSMFAGTETIVKSIDGGRVRITRFVPGKDERRLECSTRLDDIVRTLAAIGVRYPDILQAVQEAQRTGALAARVEINALPTPDRQYEGSEDSSANDDAGQAAASPLPGLFFERNSERDDAPTEDLEPADDDESEKKSSGMWSKMKDWLTPG